MSMDLIGIHRVHTLKSRVLNATIGRFNGNDYRNADLFSLLNMSNSNWSRFTRFVSDVLQDECTQCQEIVDSQVLNDTGDADYDAWRAQVLQEERDELDTINALYESWSTETCSLSDVLAAMTICMYDPNHAQYKGYIHRILNQGVTALTVSNPHMYWA